MKNAVITASSHCNTMVGVRVEMPTAESPGTVMFLTASVVVSVPKMTSFVELVGEMLCIALDFHNQLNFDHIPTSVASWMMAAVIYKRVLCNMDTRASHAMLHAVITVSLHCRTTAGVCVEMHTALRHSIVRLMMGNAETIVPMMISFVGLAGAMQCTALECRAWV